MKEFIDQATEKMIAAGQSSDGDAVRAARLAGSLEACKKWSEVRPILESVNAILVTDRGSGMTRLALESVFLRIGTPSRLNTQKSDGLKRTILGNKGIGRLSMMRLGSCATVTSWTTPRSAHMVAFDWLLFEDADASVDDVSIDVEKASPALEAESGATIEITSLRSASTKGVAKARPLAGGFDA